MLDLVHPGTGLDCSHPVLPRPRAVSTPVVKLWLWVLFAVLLRCCVQVQGCLTVTPRQPRSHHLQTLLSLFPFLNSAFPHPCTFLCPPQSPHKATIALKLLSPHRQQIWCFWHCDLDNLHLMWYSQYSYLVMVAFQAHTSKRVLSAPPGYLWSLPMSHTPAP